MGLKNVLIAVADIEKSKKFYKEIFGLYSIRDFGDNVMLSEGLVLQSKSTWQKMLKSDISVGNSFELFFEEYNLDEFVLALKEKEGVKFIGDIYENAWGRRCIRLLDPDGYLIEVAEK